MSYVNIHKNITKFHCPIRFILHNVLYVRVSCFIIHVPVSFENKNYKINTLFNQNNCSREFKLNIFGKIWMNSIDLATC
jgi:hypothetical protein